MRTRTSRTALLLVGLASCFDSASTRCPSGTICPEGSVCDEAHGGCVDPAQISSCSDVAAGSKCSYQGVPDGTCVDGVCLPENCGNGRRDSDEVCDDGNTLSGDGCSSDCRSQETCGNGIVDPVAGESCDDGNNVDGDMCQANCRISSCGDGVVDSNLGEECDDGLDNSTEPDAPCRPNCQLRRCGDGIVDGQSGELCDDGNLLPLDGCTPDCLSDETCGNNYVDFVPGELCDDGSHLSGDGCSSMCTLETPAWVERTLDVPIGRYSHVMEYDARRGVVVLFGGFEWDAFVALSDTWEWDGTWTRRQTDLHPPGVIGPAMAYDHHRGVMVVFGGILGGYDGVLTNQTWEWDGRVWTRRLPPVSPPPRHDHSLAYDAARKRVVLHGGSVDDASGAVPALTDTWEWNGDSWTEVLTDATPPGREGAYMAYDAKRGEIVLFGGVDNVYDDNYYDDTWTYDGADWTLEEPAEQPEPRRHGRMVFDPIGERILLFGGRSSVYYDDTWAWNGDTWSPVITTAAPSARLEFGMAFDSAHGEAMIFSGNYGRASDTWALHGDAWEEITSSEPLDRWNYAMATDRLRGEIVLFGGDVGANDEADTWIYREDRWTEIVPDNAPSPRREAAMTNDSTRGELLLFGGFSAGAQQDTWTWNGEDWTPRDPADKPPARQGGVLVDDAARGRLVLFGGYRFDSGQIYLADTWEWNGTNWIERLPAHSPPGRSRFAMAYDPIRQRTVLYGGFPGGNPGYTDTWEWDGTDWIERFPATQLPPLTGHQMAYDPNRQRVILTGGYINGTFISEDTWEWDGNDWTRLAIDTASPGRHSADMDFDPRRGELFVTKGIGVDGVNEYEASDSNALAFRGGARQSCGTGFDSDGDGLVGCADPDCWPLCRPLCPPGTICDASTPQCGDGECNLELESCRLCPTDCGQCTPQCGDFHCDPAEGVSSCPGDCTP